MNKILLIFVFLFSSCANYFYKEIDVMRAKNEEDRIKRENSAIDEKNQGNLKKAKEFEVKINELLKNKYVVLTSFENPIINCGVDKEKDIFLKKLLFKEVKVDSQYLSSIDTSIVFETEKKEQIIFNLPENNDQTAESYVHFCFVNSSKNKTYNYTSKTKQMIKENQIQIGFDKDQVRLSIGNPDKINKKISQHGSSEQWVYGRNYVYFKNDIVVTIQQR